MAFMVSGSGSAKLKPATHVKVRHILCEKQSKALEALDKVKGGEQFATVRITSRNLVRDCPLLCLLFQRYELPSFRWLQPFLRTRQDREVTLAGKAARMLWVTLQRQLLSSM